MLMEETKESMNARIRSTNPTWMLVSGPDIGHLNVNREKVLLFVLTDIFYRKVYDNANRTKQDLYDVAFSVINHMNLKPTKELAEKIIDSLMWSEGKNFAQFSFIANSFNETTMEWEEQRFQYLTLDRQHTNLDEQYEVFQLTEEAEELVIKSQEVMAEFDLTIQTVISEILIRKGKFKQALTNLQNLDMKVRRLIYKEEEHKKQILKDPKGAIYIDYKKWGDSLDEVKDQFREELARYDEMDKMLKSRIEREPDNEDIFKLIYRISVTSREHDKLARLVIGNIQKEFHFRSDPSLFTLLWRPPETSFKQTVMEERILPKGLREPEDVFKIMNVLFSPAKKFIYPIQWMIREQGYREKQIDFDPIDGEGDDIENTYKLDVDWDEIIDLWSPILMELLEKGEISNTHLLTLPESQLHRWMKCREAMDMWVLFMMRDRTFTIPEIIPDRIDDQKIGLIGKAVEQNNKLRKILGQEVIVKPLNKRNIVIDEKVAMTPLRISLK